ncbi:uncharacterized protein LOC127443615 [Myxocyprinus asiaticus]|uniref:uncharacterized protein LOC127443615 n=1 Tax=Myxocyprinus asiaticus TaxID=70543 RepID=UPI0022215D54|nr:uncharacterized protein LOC127443615 [Myxocyprinus asiaticus]
MEWRIVLGVLCLIGILPVPGNAANDTNATVFEFNLSFSINDTFIPDYSNMSTDAAIHLKQNITSQINPLFQNITNFLQMLIQQFRNGSIVTDSILQFSNGTRPNATVLRQTLVDRVGNGNFLKIITNSINVTESVKAPSVTTTTTTTTTTVNSTSPAAVVKLNISFSINQDFKAIYSNLSHPETNLLAKNITDQISSVYKRRFPSFFRMFIWQFRSGSIVTDAVLEFDKNGTSPNVSEVAQTLRDAVANGNVTIQIDPNSVNVTDPTVVTTAEPPTQFTVTFKIIETFNAVYSNLSAPETIQLATNITNQVLKVYKKRFLNFIRMFIRQFRSGSIVTDGTLEFDKNGTIPSAKDVAITLRDAVTNGNFTFSIDPNSIKVTDSSGNTSSRSPVLASMLTALWMTLASLLLSAVMHL